MLTIIPIVFPIHWTLNSGLSIVHRPIHWTVDGNILAHILTDNQSSFGPSIKTRGIMHVIKSMGFSIQRAPPEEWGKPKYSVLNLCSATAFFPILLCLALTDIAAQRTYALSLNKTQRGRSGQRRL